MKVANDVGLFAPNLLDRRLQRFDTETVAVAVDRLSNVDKRVVGIMDQ